MRATSAEHVGKKIGQAKPRPLIVLTLNGFFAWVKDVIAVSAQFDGSGIKDFGDDSELCESRSF